MLKKTGILFMGIGAALLIAALSLLLYNRAENDNAGDMAEIILPAVIDAIEHPADTIPEDSATEPDGVNEYDTDADMTVVYIDGYGYIGYISIPVLELDLPVMTDWDYTKLKTAPCRYFGSAKTDDLVICGHNYDRHFGRLKNLQEGDLVLFTDMDGVTISYEVKEVETLQPTQITEMIESDYDLTLYTCTYGGATRVTVRCDRTETD
mgnify:CR=1 FL=1